MRSSYGRSGLSILALLLSGWTSAQTDVWTIGTDTIEPGKYYGETVANGAIGIVSSAEPFRVKDVVLNGAFDLYGRGRVSNILKTFNLVNMSLNIDGTDISDFSVVQHVHQALDMRHANLCTSFDFQDKASVSYTYYALRQLPYTALVDITIMARKDIDIYPTSEMEAPDMLREVQNYNNDIDGGARGMLSLLTSTARSPTGKLFLAASDCFLFDEGRGHIPSLIHEMPDANLHTMRFTKHLKAGEAYHFAVVGSTLTSAQSEDPLNEAERLTIFAAMQGSARLIAAHNRAWDDLWTSDIVIGGDDTVQRDVHSLIYHLYSFVREGSGYSVSPMGLSGLGYNGHVFWDSELWMYPALLLLQPRIAASLLEYRYERLKEAKQNALLTRI